jgi:hypothetical protein
MANENPKNKLVFAICLTVAFVLQLYGTIRYINRLPDDKVGVTLYVATTALFAVLAVVNYVQWAGMKKRGS